MGCLTSAPKGPGLAPGFFVFEGPFVRRGETMKVEKSQFDAILKTLINTPPKPFTPKRKARKKKAKPQA